MPSAYYSNKDLAALTGYSIRTICRDKAEMRKLIPRIYSLNDFCGNNTKFAAYQHFKNHQAILMVKPGSVKPFTER